jgi:Fur family transcriptional regulator, peroxide stress response regulator
MTAPRDHRELRTDLIEDVDWAAVGLRRTPQREVVLSVVRSAAQDPAIEYPTAEWIHRRAREHVPDISLATVYRTLRILKERGLIYEFSGGVGPSRYDGTRHDHEHVRCICCGTVIDVDLPEIVQVRQLVATRTGYVIGSAPLLFQGVCRGCQTEHRTSGASPRRTTTPDGGDGDTLDRDLAGGPW